MSSFPFDDSENLMFHFVKSNNDHELSATISTGVAGVPGWLAGISILPFVIKQTARNAKDVKKLASEIERWITFLDEMKSERTFSPAMADRICRLSSTLSGVSGELKAMASRGVMKRLVRCADDIQAIGGHNHTIERAIQSFMEETRKSIDAALDRSNRDRENFDHSMMHGDVRMDLKDGYPPRALFAAFNRNPYRTRCSQGTRKDVLDEIYRWIDAKDTVNDMPGASMDNWMKSRIFWINGSVGTEKTTNGYTVAEECKERGILGASFCLRDDDDCSDPRLVFTTIAYQLGIFSPLFKAEVSRVVTSNPDMGYNSIPSQLEQLIVNTLRLLAGSIPSCVVVVDALDECRNCGTTSLVLSSLSRHVHGLSPIKFLVTSRPEYHITTAHKLILHDVPLDVVEADITRYLPSRLELTRMSPLGFAFVERIVLTGAEKILNWLEVCSLTGELRNALLSLNTAQQTISKSHIPDTLKSDMLNPLRDYERLTLEFFPIISSCSL